MTATRILIFTLGLAVSGVFGCGGDSPAPPESQAEPSQDSQAKAPAVVDAPKSQPPQEAEPTTVGPPVTKAPQLLSPAQLADGWISLFDGKTMFGWNPTSNANWRVEDGTITVSSGDPGFLATNSQFANYVLHLEFRSESGTNSGVFLRTPVQPQDPKRDCYELNIANADNPFPTGSLVGRQKVEGDTQSDEWQTFEVTVNGADVTVMLDGKEVLRYKDPQSLKRGHISLQRNQGAVTFRNIRLKPLGLQPIFNGKNLDGWRAPESASKFTVNDQGELNVKNGRGHLETEARYGDFVLQLECISHAKNLNSGIFFRCVPGSAMDGYESQIHNGYENSDRRQPIDHGTGGIFRRQRARLVVADDLAWFHKTIVVDDNHVAVWVNGYLVSDWSDTRSPDDNPRRGVRMAAGTIMIQGHDPTTDLSFRNLRIVEMPRE